MEYHLTNAPSDYIINIYLEATTAGLSFDSADAESPPNSSSPLPFSPILFSTAKVGTTRDHLTFFQVAEIWGVWCNKSLLHAYAVRFSQLFCAPSAHALTMSPSQLVAKNPLEVLNHSVSHWYMELADASMPAPVSRMELRTGQHLASWIFTERQMSEYLESLDDCIKAIQKFSSISEIFSFICGSISFL